MHRKQDQLLVAKIQFVSHSYASTCNNNASDHRQQETKIKVYLHDTAGDSDLPFSFTTRSLLSGICRALYFCSEF